METQRGIVVTWIGGLQGRGMVVMGGGRGSDGKHSMCSITTYLTLCFCLCYRKDKREK